MRYRLSTVVISPSTWFKMLAQTRKAGWVPVKGASDLNLQVAKHSLKPVAPLSSAEMPNLSSGSIQWLLKYLRETVSR